jgi:coenzyme F420-dependent glucose-6-phosphate dehydrogenase
MHLGALGQVSTLPIGTGVTPVLHHYHPAIIAQAFMALADLYPGRVFLGVGSGEAMNEVPLGMDWVTMKEKRRRFDKGLEAITRLWNGETVTMDGGWFSLKEARLYTMAETRPKMYVSAFGPLAAKIAGKYGEGLWTLPDPQGAPKVIAAYRESCEAHGKEEGEIIVQCAGAWAATDEAAVQGALRWKPAALADAYSRDLSDPAVMQQRAEAEISDQDFKDGFIVSSDPEVHVARLRRARDVGASVVCVQVIGSADPLGTIRMYGEHVLPKLRAEEAASVS